MSGDDWFLIVVGVYALVGCVIVGVYREVTGKIGDSPLIAISWPLWPLFGAGVGVCWLFMWLGRAPARFMIRRARARRAAERIAKAEVRRG